MGESLHFHVVVFFIAVCIYFIFLEKANHIQLYSAKFTLVMPYTKTKKQLEKWKEKKEKRKKHIAPVSRTRQYTVDFYKTFVWKDLTYFLYFDFILTVFLSEFWIENESFSIIVSNSDPFLYCWWFLFVPFFLYQPFLHAAIRMYNSFLSTLLNPSTIHLQRYEASWKTNPKDVLQMFVNFNPVFVNSWTVPAFMEVVDPFASTCPACISTAQMLS